MKELQYPFESDYLLQHKKSIRRELLKGDSFVDKRIALLSGSTIGELKNMLEIFLLNEGIRPEFYVGEYDRFYEDVVFENQELQEFQPDLIYIHTTSKNIRRFPMPGADAETCDSIYNAEWSRFQSVWESAEAKYHCPLIQNNFEMLSYRVLGNRDIYDESGALHMIHRLNGSMYEYAAGHSNFYLNDLSYEASCFGLDNWFDDSKWYLYKYPFSVDAIPLVAFNIANIIKSIYGKNKKALALDLDNTLWGGVIGDDGVENLQLGIETPEGMAFSAFQDYLKRLSMTGVSLNICSKNDENLYKEGFTHSASILKDEDFIVKKVNWVNKDENIHAIASEMNIGEDALVFVDDNPVERGLVEEQTKAAVVPVNSPESYVRMLDRSGFFECTHLSDEDKKRNTYYRDNLKRAKEMESFRDYGEYLESLKMVCRMSHLGVENIQRVTQLINKTNQFNLTTKRFTMEEVEAYVADADTISFCGQLFDKYGDNGIVSVLMAKCSKDIAEIGLWLMSCRVFKRDLEYAMFDELVQICQNRGVRKLRGLYFKTKKNVLVEEFYQTLGFTEIERDENHGVWEYEIPEAYSLKNRYIACTAGGSNEQTGNF